MIQNLPQTPSFPAQPPSFPFQPPRPAPPPTPAPPKGVFIEFEKVQVYEDKLGNQTVVFSGRVKFKNSFLPTKNTVEINVGADPSKTSDKVSFNVALTQKTFFGKNSQIDVTKLKKGVDYEFQFSGESIVPQFGGVLNRAILLTATVTGTNGNPMDNQTAIAGGVLYLIKRLISMD